MGSTYIYFLLESTRKGHLIPGAVVFFIWRGRIFHSNFFPLKDTFPSDNRRIGLTSRDSCRFVPMLGARLGQRLGI